MSFKIAPNPMYGVLPEANVLELCDKVRVLMQSAPGMSLKDVFAAVKQRYLEQIKLLALDEVTDAAVRVRIDELINAAWCKFCEDRLAAIAARMRGGAVVVKR